MTINVNVGINIDVAALVKWGAVILALLIL